MKLTSGYFKNNYQILMVKLLILGLFIFCLIKAYKNESFYRPAIILLIPLIGIFINRKGGWVLIQAYFYFLMSNLIFSSVLMDISDNQTTVIYVIGFLIFLSFIFVMNQRKISNVFYGLEKCELLGRNIFASIMGMTITIAVALFKAYDTSFLHWITR